MSVPQRPTNSSRPAKTARPPGLPDFEHPPVTEVYLSIQFGSLPNFRSGHIGLLWNEFRKEYPQILEQMPLQPTFETFGVPTPEPFFKIQVENVLASPMSRFLFMEDSGDELVQIQQDRIVHNWRKQRGEQACPRYDAIRDKFWSEVDKFAKFVRDEKLGGLKPNQCEVSYTNAIELPDGQNPHLHVDRISPLWSGAHSEPLPFAFEHVTINARYLIREAERPAGRVYVTFAPGYRPSDHAPQVYAQIIAKGKPQDESIDSAFALLDQQRDAIVRTFAAVTTKEMHKLWGRTDER